MQQIPRSEAQSHHWPILEPLTGNFQHAVAINTRVCVAGDRGRVNLALPSEMVSRAHALFLSDEHGIYLRDLASLGHVFVNHQQVREAELQDGDLLRIGPFEFRCLVPSAKDGNGGLEHGPAAELKTPDESVRLPLTSRTIVLGRRDDCDVLMSGDSVAPAHAVLFELDKRHYIRDLSTRGGTFVNDQRVTQTELKGDDLIRIGDSVLKYAPATASPGTSSPNQASIEQVVAASAPTQEDLDVVPLAQEPQEELPSLAAGQAEKREADEQAGAPSPSVPSPPVQLSDSGIIPLLDESESAPGIAEAAAPELPASDAAPISLADDDSEPPAAAPNSQPREKLKSTGRESPARENDPDRAPTLRTRSKKSAF